MPHIVAGVKVKSPLERAQEKGKLLLRDVNRKKYYQHQPWWQAGRLIDDIDVDDDGRIYTAQAGSFVVRLNRTKEYIPTRMAGIYSTLHDIVTGYAAHCASVEGDLLIPHPPEWVVVPYFKKPTPCLDDLFIIGDEYGEGIGKSLLFQPSETLEGMPKGWLEYLSWTGHFGENQGGSKPETFPADFPECFLKIAR